MKVLYVNPNINHHKLPFFHELQKIYGKTEVCYATPVREELWRSQMGFSANISDSDNILYITKDNFKEFEEIFLNSEIVLCAIRDYWKMMRRRLIEDKITFYFSERWFKEPIGRFRLIHPKILNLVFQFRRLSKYSKFFYLAQGKTAAIDFFRCNIAEERTFSFGYFPPSSIQTEARVDILPKDKINILWCGRMISTKRVDLLVRVFINLQKKYDNIHLCLVGNGPCLKKIKDLLYKGCESYKYTLIDYLPNNQVRSLMKAADIYVLPSTGWEGWGAVINEAMSESCAIVAGDRIGAVTSIFNSSTGLSFPSENEQGLYNALVNLIEDPKTLRQQQTGSEKLIKSLWSPKIAAERFQVIISRIKNNQDIGIYQEGPFSLISK